MHSCSLCLDAGDDLSDDDVPDLESPRGTAGGGPAGASGMGAFAGMAGMAGMAGKLHPMFKSFF